MVRWFLGLHSPTYSCSVSPDKAGRDTQDANGSPEEEIDTLPVLGESSGSLEKALDAPPFDLSSIPPAPPATPRKIGGTGQATDSLLPPPATPSLEQTLIKVENSKGYVPPPLPAGLSTSALNSRLDPKKKIK